MSDGEKRVVRVTIEPGKVDGLIVRAVKLSDGYSQIQEWNGRAWVRTKRVSWGEIMYAAPFNSTLPHFDQPDIGSGEE